MINGRLARVLAARPETNFPHRTLGKATAAPAGAKTVAESSSEGRSSWSDDSCTTHVRFKSQNLARGQRVPDDWSQVADSLAGKRK